MMRDTMRFRLFLPIIPIFVAVSSLGIAQDSVEPSSPAADQVAADEIDSGVAEVQTRRIWTKRSRNR